MRTEGGAAIDVFEGDDGGEDEEEGEEEGEQEDGVEERAVGDVASCDLDLHQVEQPIAGGDRDSGHARNLELELEFGRFLNPAL
ncbi:hypothetical protein ACLOJK_035409 [Asimina triloba]